MPLGYIDESDEDSGSFSMARPTDRDFIVAGTPVLIRNEHQDYRATALLSGEVTETTGVTASFIITSRRIDANWPAHIDPKGAGNPVYLGLPNTFDPDFSRSSASQDEILFLMQMAEQHYSDTDIEPRGAVYVPTTKRQP